MGTKPELSICLREGEIWLRKEDKRDGSHPDKVQLKQPTVSFVKFKIVEPSREAGKYDRIPMSCFLNEYTFYKPSKKKRR